MFVLKKINNYDLVDKTMFQPQKVEMREASAQFGRPPLQY